MHTSILNILSTTKTRLQALGPHKCSECIGEQFEKRDFLSAVESAKTEGLVPVIAEIKPASPGKVFRNILPSTALRLALEMEQAGAIAISVLTEPQVFRGSLENLNVVRENVSLPVLRKDFIIDTRQLEEAETDLVLLIAGILGKELPTFVDITFEKGFEPLVEVHNIDELELSLKTSTRIIGINNRSLETLKIDLVTTKELAPIIREYDFNHGTRHLIISESGMKNAEDIKRVIEAGVDAVLIGSVIMESDDVFETTNKLVQSFCWR